METEFSDNDRIFTTEDKLESSYSKNRSLYGETVNINEVILS